MIWTKCVILQALSGVVKTGRVGWKTMLGKGQFNLIHRTNFSGYMNGENANAVSSRTAR